MANTIGHAKAEEMLFNARLVDTQEALQLGLVHEVVDTPQLMAATLARVQAAMKGVSVSARAQSKSFMREELVKAWVNDLDNEIEWGWILLSSPQVTKSLEMALSRLGGGKPTTAAKL
jgi:enoyl-CoA hydratase/carnithine racemase